MDITKSKIRGYNRKIRCIKYVVEIMLYSYWFDDQVHFIIYNKQVEHADWSQSKWITEIN